MTAALDPRTTYSTPATRIEVLDLRGESDSWEAPGSLQEAGDWCHEATKQIGVERYRVMFQGGWWWSL